MLSCSQTLALCTVSFTDLLLVSSVLNPSFVHAILQQHQWMSRPGNFSFEEYYSISRYIETSCAFLRVIDRTYARLAISKYITALEQR